MFVLLHKPAIYSKLRKSFFFLMLSIFSFTLLLPGCKKDNEENLPDIGLSFTSSSYQPLELATIQANGDLSGGIIQAKVDNDVLAVELMDSNRIAVLIPLKPSGSYTLKLETEQYGLKELPFVIGAYSQIINPEVVITSFETAMTNNVQTLNYLSNTEGWNIDPQNISEVQQLMTVLQQELANASTEEKEYVAYLVQSNKLNNLSLENVAFVDSFYDRSSADAGDELNRIGRSFVATMVTSYATAALLGGLIKAPEFSVTKIGAVITGVALGIELCYAYGLIDRLANCMGKAVSFEFNGTASFTPGGTIDAIDNIRYRNITDSDFSENTYIRDIVRKVKLFETYWNSLKAGFQRIKSWFFGAPAALSGLPSALRQTEVYKNYYARHDYLTVGNSSNNNIQVSLVDNSGEKRIKATASGINQPTNFTFTITYNHPGLGNQITKTVNAEIQGVNCDTLSTITDPRDGETYQTVRVGNQIWFAENLRYSGNIPNVQDATAWGELTSPGWCHYDNNSSYNATYGKLYNWYAVNNSSLCPSGWHIPSEAEWLILKDSITNSSNQICFVPFEGGNRGNSFNNFYDINVVGRWWSSEEDLESTNITWDAIAADSYNPGYFSTSSLWNKCWGMSIRCLKD